MSPHTKQSLFGPSLLSTSEFKIVLEQNSCLFSTESGEEPPQLRSPPSHWYTRRLQSLSPFSSLSGRKQNPLLRGLDSELLGLLGSGLMSRSLYRSRSIIVSLNSKEVDTCSCNNQIQMFSSAGYAVKINQMMEVIYKLQAKHPLRSRQTRTQLIFHWERGYQPRIERLAGFPKRQELVQTLVEICFP